MKYSLILCLLMLCASPDSTAQQAVGQWQDHLPYVNVTHVIEVGDLLYCATPDAIWSYDPTQGHVSRKSKVNGLSDVGVSSMAYNEENEALLIGYSNGNLDLIGKGGTTNLADIKRSNVIGDKGVYGIHMDGNKAWLACGFGIVLLDIPNLEVSETYFIGPGAASIKVNDVVTLDNEVYAATEGGLLRANINSNLADFANWSSEAGIPNPTGEFDVLRRFQDKILVRFPFADVIYVKEDGVWGVLTGTSEVFNEDMQIAGDELIHTTRFAVRRYSSDLNIIEERGTYVDSDWRTRKNTTIYIDGDFWVGDEENGLVKRASNGEETKVVPSGPYSNKSWSLAASDGQAWVAHGGLQTNWNNTWNSDAFSGINAGTWTQTKWRDELVDSRDHVAVAIDPLNTDLVYFGSWFTGLTRYKRSTGEITIMNEAIGNAMVEASTEHAAPNQRYQVGGIDFDPSGNLWLSNSYTEKPIKMMTREGDWYAYGCPASVGGSDLFGDIIYGDNGIVWVVMPRGEGLLSYGTYGTITDLSDDECKRMTNQVGDGDLPTNDVFSVAEDLDGEIWVGTSEGPTVNYNSNILYTSEPADFQQILLEQDGNVEILLGNEIITTIAIDGANRKWFGTQNGGAFLMSEDGGRQILHFTADNSPLFSNEIKDIAIEPSTGEVFFATIAGIVSYKADATTSSEENECIAVYPNPVRQNYQGPITIDGLVSDSEVKITDVAGNLVFQTVANGGRAVWNGTDFSGKRVVTGVYFALSSSQDGESSCSAKILLIN